MEELLKAENFSQFSLDYYSDSLTSTGTPLTSREAAAAALEKSQAFVRNFQAKHPYAELGGQPAEGGAFGIIRQFPHNDQFSALCPAGRGQSPEKFPSAVFSTGHAGYADAADAHHGCPDHAAALKCAFVKNKRVSLPFPLRPFHNGQIRLYPGSSGFTGTEHENAAARGIVLAHGQGQRLGAAVQGVRFVFPEEQGQKPSGSALPVPFPHAPVIALAAFHLGDFRIRLGSHERKMVAQGCVRIFLPQPQTHQADEFCSLNGLGRIGRQKFREQFFQLGS